jgi:two-component system chemotaxis response regulator CheB
VLVVDDSVFMRRMISDMIGRFPGYEVIATAADGEEALRMIEAHDPDVVTLDIEMPRLDGFGVLERVTASRPRPIVVLSAYTSVGTEAALRALELGAVEFVAKPSGPISFDVARVEGRLFEALEAAVAADLDRWSRPRRPRAPSSPSPPPPAVPGHSPISVARCQPSWGPPYWWFSTCHPGLRRRWQLDWMRSAQ